eukprot:6399090-Pyramimonas_sp.AAC.1
MWLDKPAFHNLSAGHGRALTEEQLGEVENDNRASAFTKATRKQRSARLMALWATRSRIFYLSGVSLPDGSVELEPHAAAAALARHW